MNNVRLSRKLADMIVCLNSSCAEVSKIAKLRCFMDAISRCPSARLPNDPNAYSSILDTPDHFRTIRWYMDRCRTYLTTKLTKAKPRFSPVSLSYAMYMREIWPNGLNSSYAASSMASVSKHHTGQSTGMVLSARDTFTATCHNGHAERMPFSSVERWSESAHRTSSAL